MKLRSMGAVVAVSMLFIGVAACGDDTSNASNGTGSTKNGSNNGAEKKSTPNNSSDGGSGDSGSGSGGVFNGTTQACIGLASAFGKAIAQITTDPKAAESAIENLKSKVPDSLSGDVDTLLTAYSSITKDGIAKAGQALSTPEVESASQHLSTFFANQCKGG